MQGYVVASDKLRLLAMVINNVENSSIEALGN